MLQGGPKSNTITGEAGNDTIRTTGSGRNTVRAGAGDDTVDAYGQGSTTVDCGPGNDTVNVGWNKHVRTVECEQVHRRYKN
jgi:Ca2+-binding RTX toxin-like protein